MINIAPVKKVQEKHVSFENIQIQATQVHQQQIKEIPEILELPKGTEEIEHQKIRNLKDQKSKEIKLYKLNTVCELHLYHIKEINKLPDMLKNKYSSPIYLQSTQIEEIQEEMWNSVLNKYSKVPFNIEININQEIYTINDFLFFDGDGLIIKPNQTRIIKFLMPNIQLDFKNVRIINDVGDIVLYNKLQYFNGSISNDKIKIGINKEIEICTQCIFNKICEVVH